jgi:hypothetical protein
LSWEKKIIKTYTCRNNRNASADLQAGADWHIGKFSKGLAKGRIVGLARSVLITFYCSFYNTTKILLSLKSSNYK